MSDTEISKLAVSHLIRLRQSQLRVDQLLHDIESAGRCSRAKAFELLDNSRAATCAATSFESLLAGNPPPPVGDLPDHTTPPNPHML